MSDLQTQLRAIRTAQLDTLNAILELSNSVAFIVDLIGTSDQITGELGQKAGHIVAANERALAAVAEAISSLQKAAADE